MKLMSNRSVYAAVLFVLLAVPAHAATYTVKASGGGNFTTIQACANAAQPGDTCEVYAGTYGETVVPAQSGSAGSPITFLAHSGDKVIVRSFNLTGRTYVTVSGFEISGSSSYGITIKGSNHAVIEDNTIHSSSQACIRDDPAPASHDVIIRSNTIYACGGSGIQFFGDRVLIEGNTIRENGYDSLYGGGSYVVVRNNRFVDLYAGYHVDGFQTAGWSLKYSLVEGNVYQNCTDPTGNCHFMIVRDQTAPSADTIIFRYNFSGPGVDGTAGVLWGGSGDDVRNVHHYNNTHTNDSAGVPAAVFVNAPYGVVKNNICYTTASSASQQYVPAYGASSQDGNLVYALGYSGTWNEAYSRESTYGRLANRDPLFANYPTDGTLQATSPARGAGVALTTVAAGDGGTGTTLILADARYFQPGWAGVAPDWIRIGASTVARIAAIDYATNTVTLASSVARSDGDPVYLYRKSDGKVVLTGATHDVGAFPYGAAGIAAPAPPSNVRVVVQ